jgi:ribosome biogenesis protein UTP30
MSSQSKATKDALSLEQKATEGKNLENPSKELGLKPHDHLNSNLVVRAVTALLKHEENKKKQNKKEQLFEADDIISLIITLNKVPQKPRSKPYRIYLPYPLWNDECDICFFVKDPEKEWKELFETVGAAVKKVIGLAKMRRKYNTFEARRKLLGSYDLFLCDESISLLLRRFLGRQFFQSKKYPIPIRITRTSLADKISKVRHSTYLYLRTGSCLNVRIARVSFTTKQICVNILRTVNDIVNRIPGKWKNVKSICIKTPSSIALPVYNQLPSPTLRLHITTKNQQHTKEKKPKTRKNAKDKIKKHKK